MIDVRGLSKQFRRPLRVDGRFSTLRTLVSRKYETKLAVDDISFSIDKGEVVGYLGPNGAGKSTTIKMLTGILHPTAGTPRPLNALGHLLLAVTVFSISLAYVRISWTPGKIALCACFILGGALVEAAIQIAVSASAFRFTDSRQMNVLTEGFVRNVSSYP